MLHEIIGGCMSPQLDTSLAAFISENIAEFAKVHAAAVCAEKGGGISDTEAFWLYYIVKSIKPKIIIESGTLYGYSLYFIKSAASPDCEIHSFDIDQQHSHKFPGVQYHESDWMDWPRIGLNSDTLIFFDDHIDHGKRYEEAVARDIRHIIFHDNYTYQCSHKSIRYYALPDANLCFIFPNFPIDKLVSADINKNSKNYRWLTYVRRER